MQNEWRFCSNCWQSHWLLWQWHQFWSFECSGKSLFWCYLLGNRILHHEQWIFLSRIFHQLFRIWLLWPLFQLLSLNFSFLGPSHGWDIVVWRPQGFGTTCWIQLRTVPQYYGASLRFQLDYKDSPSLFFGEQCPEMPLSWTSWDALMQLSCIFI